MRAHVHDIAAVAEIDFTEVDDHRVGPWFPWIPLNIAFGLRRAHDVKSGLRILCRRIIWPGELPIGDKTIDIVVVVPAPFDAAELVISEKISGV